MNYDDGEQVHLWDRVETHTEGDGIVVYSTETNEYAPDFPKEQWEDHGEGVMVATSRMGLVLMTAPLCCIRLVRRGGQPQPEEWIPFQRAIDSMGGGLADA